MAENTPDEHRQSNLLKAFDRVPIQGKTDNSSVEGRQFAAEELALLNDLIEKAFIGFQKPEKTGAYASDPINVKKLELAHALNQLNRNHIAPEDVVVLFQGHEVYEKLQAESIANALSAEVNGASAQKQFDKLTQNEKDAYLKYRGLMSDVAINHKISIAELERGVYELQERLFQDEV